ncbi:capsid protein [Halodurantibacterium flavum]|uniref:Capsid protein n=1 Tax=Halodurantibacterium flavum TaxID=1382802 RepID=A0ABW4SAT4_9RHOB
MSSPNRPFVVDPVLTAISVGYRNTTAMRIADQVLPRRPVSGEKFKWTEYPISEAFNTPDARVGRRGRVQQLEFGGKEQTSSVEDFGLETPIPYSDIEAAATARAQNLSAYDPEAHSVSMLTDTLENIREVRVAQIVHDRETYAPDKRIVLSGGSRFSDYANSDPISVLKAGMEGTLIFAPNTLVMGRQVWSKLSSHPVIVNAAKGNLTNQGIVSIEQFIEIFSGEGLRRVLIGDAWHNTARPGQPVSLQRAWGKHIAMLHLNDTAMVEGGGITFGLTAEYGSRVSGRIPDPDVGLQGGVRVRTGERVKELVVARDVGYFIENAVA